MNSSIKFLIKGQFVKKNFKSENEVKFTVFTINHRGNEWPCRPHTSLVNLRFFKKCTQWAVSGKILGSETDLSSPITMAHKPLSFPCIRSLENVSFYVKPAPELQHCYICYILAKSQTAIKISS